MHDTWFMMILHPGSCILHPTYFPLCLGGIVNAIHARGGSWTPTGFAHWILSPARLPVPPLSLCGSLQSSLYDHYHRSRGSLQSSLYDHYHRSRGSLNTYLPTTMLKAGSDRQYKSQNGLRGIRTHDPVIKSHLLYQAELAAHYNYFSELQLIIFYLRC